MAKIVVGRPANFAAVKNAQPTASRNLFDFNFKLILSKILPAREPGHWSKSHLRRSFQLASVLVFFLFFSAPFQLRAQLYCPPNINFELGNLSYWSFYTGTNYSNLTLPNVTNSGAIANRHVMTSGAAVDPYGNFPIVDPSSGNYSLKIGNDIKGAQVDQARYVFTIPSNVNNYSLIYRYAVVFEDPKHSDADQPYFRVRVYDSSTGAVINCASVMYVSSSAIPGFSQSSLIGRNNAVVYYKPWSTVSLNLSGQAGKTLVAEFTSSDCALTGHFGYGYVDLSCGLFSISANSCTPTTSLTAPFGFMAYTWYNSNFTTLVDTGRTISVPTPATLTQYKVVLTPYPDLGCPDTLTTQVIGSSLSVDAGPDTMLCDESAIQLQPKVSSNVPIVSYSWSPATGLSCTSCASPMASPAQNTSYVLTVTDSFGCVKQDTVLVRAKPSMTVATTPATCFGSASGRAIATATQGAPPYSYSWTTSPVLNSDTAKQLLPGTYTVTATDAKGCSISKSIQITSPSALDARITSTDSVTCAGAKNGKATVSVSGGVAPYGYQWSTVPAQTTTIATGLDSGHVVVTVTDNNGCVDTAEAIVGARRPLKFGLTSVNPHCFQKTDGSITVAPVTGGISPYQYSINGGAFTSTNQYNGLNAGSYLLRVKDQQGCTLDSTVQLVEPAVLSVSFGLQSPACFGQQTGAVNITATGGTTPYQYSINGGSFLPTPQFGGLAAGSYFLRVRDQQGCTSDSTLQISQPAALNASFSVKMPNCFGESSGAINVIANGGTIPYQYSFNGGAFSSTNQFSGLKAGSYLLRLRDQNGCAIDSTLQLIDPPLLNVSFSIKKPNCFGESNGVINVTANGGTLPYQYAIGSGSFGGSPVFSGLGAGNKSIQVRDSLGCLALSTVTVLEPALLTANVATTPVICNGDNSGTISINAQGGTMPLRYALGNGTFAGGSVFNGLGKGTYPVHVKDTLGCVFDTVATITEPATVRVNVVVASALCKQATNGSITANGTGGIAPYQYALNSGSYQTSGTFTGLGAGSYLLHVRDKNNCVYDSLIVIGEPAALVAVASTTRVRCFGGKDGAAQVAVTGGTAPYRYTWSGLAQTGNQVSGLSAGNYSVVVTDANGCSTSATMTVTQPAKLKGTTTAVAPICHNTATGSASVSVTGGTLPYSYTWNTVPVQTTSTASAINTGFYKVVITDSVGCKDTASAVLPQTPPDVVSLSSTLVSCFGGADGTAMALASGGVAPYTYTWNTVPAKTSAYAGGLAAGTYTVTARSAAGCIVTGTLTINQPTRLSVAAADSGTCPNANDGVLQALVSGGTAPYAYLWNTLPAQAYAQAVRLKPGSYSVQVVDAKGCVDSTTATIREYESPVVEAGAAQEICLGANAVMQASGAYQYQWSPAAGLTCIDCPAPLASPTVNTVYKVTGVDVHGCPDDDTVSVYVVQHESVGVGPDAKICPGDTVRLKAWGGTERQWLSAAGMEWQNDGEALVRPVASQGYQVVITENRCFKDTLEQWVEVLPLPHIDLGPDQQAPIGSSLPLHASVRDAVSIQWIPSTCLSCADCFEPVLTMRGDAVYVAIARNELGCSATDTVAIAEVCDGTYFQFPNVFTPNGDGQNDRFYPQGAATSQVSRFTIYDRWGEAVFSKTNIYVNDPMAGWDGTYKGQPLKPDVYVYVLDAVCQGGKRFLVRGDVSLIR